MLAFKQIIIIFIFPFSLSCTSLSFSYYPRVSNCLEINWVYEQCKLDMLPSGYYILKTIIRFSKAILRLKTTQIFCIFEKYDL